MITAKNYAQEVYLDLERKIKDRDFFVLKETSSQLREVSAAIKDAKHFLMPNNGVVFDDELKGLIGEDIRLPYKDITLSYYTDLPYAGDGDCPDYRRHNVVLASEVHEGDEEFSVVSSMTKDYGKTDVYIRVIQFAKILFEGKVVWDINPACTYIPSNWHAFNGSKIEKDNIVFPMLTSIFLSDEVDAVSKLKNYTAEQVKEYKESLGKDIQDVVPCVCELCEAVNYSDARVVEIHKDRPEKRRALKTTGSEFKEFTLDIVAEQTKLKYVYADTTGSEPSHTKRAHDRRGHWRTLKSGKKIWVRACRVGNIDLGLIKKDYIINNDSL